MSLITLFLMPLSSFFDLKRFLMSLITLSWVIFFSIRFGVEFGILIHVDKFFYYGCVYSFALPYVKFDDVVKDERGSKCILFYQNLSMYSYCSLGTPR